MLTQRGVLPTAQRIDIALLTLARPQHWSAEQIIAAIRTNGTTIFCDGRGAPAAKAVIVSYTGRPRVDRVDADGRPLHCAGVT